MKIDMLYIIMIVSMCDLFSIKPAKISFLSFIPLQILNLNEGEPLLFLFGSSKL